MIFYAEDETGFCRDNGIDLVSLAVAVGEAVLEGEGVDEESLNGIEASIYIVDDEEIRKINREHRGIDSPTDVLSFPNIGFEDSISALALAQAGEDSRDPETGRLLLGDIVIDRERAAAQALEYGHGLKREIAFLTAHSLLHLLGYDHLSSEEAVLMEEKQERALLNLGITRD